jgi:hypothetical protein
VERLCFNGVDAETGEYLLPPLPVDQAAAIIKGSGGIATSVTLPAIEARKPDPSEVGRLRQIWRRLTQRDLGLPFGVDPADVRRAGWAVVFHQAESDEVKAALEPLIARRRDQVDPDCFHLLEYRSGETWRTWLTRYRVAGGTIDPPKVPYYLLLVGGPERIPFEFCHQLDVEYAVGCLHFDTAAEYERYARSVVAYETARSVPTGREALFFGTAQDAATELSANLLVRPLADFPLPEFRKTILLGEAATKSALADALTGGARRGPPAVAVTATHGVACRPSSASQRSTQGALLCQEWEPSTRPTPDQWFAGSDLAPAANVHGLITLHFACYSAGTPARDRFVQTRGQTPAVVADPPFISALPRALLAHRNGGALACIGHVERAWGYSIVSPNAIAQLQPFENALARLAAGEPVGHAVKDFNERYAVLSTSLLSLVQQVQFGASVDDRELACAWVERNDAEGYLVIGDPAVAPRVGEMARHG